VHWARPGTSVGSGARKAARNSIAPALVSAFLAIGALATFAAPSGADQVSSLQAQAKSVSQELVREQLQADAYQQLYSVTSARVASDEQAITLTQRQIKGDRRHIAKSLSLVQHLAVESYVLNGAMTSTSGAALFGEDVGTVQSANEYTIITVGNLNEAVAELHTAQRNEQSQKAVLVRQSAKDRAEQIAQSSSLSSATAAVSHLESEQAQVTGQLATAVAQQSAAQGRAAVAAVTTAQKVTAKNGGGATTTPPPGQPDTSTNTTDPALNPFLQCVVQAESGGDYQAVSPNGLYRGAFQFSQPTWNYAAQAAGRPDLIGVPPNLASKADQDTLAVALYALDGERPWLGDRCSQ
jgi:Transglycosylase-like domain